MESTLSTTISKTLNPNSNPYFISRLHCNFSTTGSIQNQLSRRIFNSDLHSLNNFTLMAVPPVRSTLQCVSSSDASFVSGGGGSGGGGGDGGGGDGSVDVSDSSSDVIILDVRVRDPLQETFYCRNAKDFLEGATIFLPPNHSMYFGQFTIVQLKLSKKMFTYIS